MTGERWALALHGGAGVEKGRDYGSAEALLEGLVLMGADRLKRGDLALDVVEALTSAMEDSGLFVAGRGSAPNRLGRVELDASLMCGRSRRAGAVASLRGYPSPVRVARRVMENTPHVLLVGQGAAEFALGEGFDPIGDFASWTRDPDGFEPEDLTDGHGTVGAVALDRGGHLAAATSTGGTYGALPGRVGDSALIGAGCWADGDVAVSCTGEGEAFIKASAASDLSARLRYAGQDLRDAANSVLETVSRRGGDGGLIAVSKSAEIIMAFNTDGMKRASASWNQPARVGSIGQQLRLAKPLVIPISPQPDW